MEQQYSAAGSRRAAQISRLSNGLLNVISWRRQVAVVTVVFCGDLAAR